MSGELVRGPWSGNADPKGARVVTEHRIDCIALGGHDLPVHPMGRVLCGNIRYGNIYLYIEEPREAVPLVTLRFAAFRDGSVIPPQAVYVTSVFEATDHAHIYVVGRVG